LPLRARLTLWYLLTLAAILLLFLALLYWQAERSLLALVDTGLRQAASQALPMVEREGDRLLFRPAEDAGKSAGRLSDSFAIYLLSPAGELWSWIGRRDELDPPPPERGVITVRQGEDQWRVHAEPISRPDGPTGWLQVAQELEPVNEALASLRAQALLGLPPALLLAGLGGAFLAWRALRPIDQVTRTAQAIDATGLDRRLLYQGPADEVGRLAATFDSMLDRLQAAFERQRHFTADAAHELRTPLAALKGRLEVTLSRPRPAAEYRQTLAEMEGHVERLIRLSNDLLFMARLDGQRAPLTKERVEVADLLAAVTEQVAPLAQAKVITVAAHAPAGLAVSGNLELLIRLLLNLLDNALKHTPSGGRITLEARASGDEVVLTVEDSGPGIPAASLPHLFERFYRVESDRARAVNGSGAGAGLGLAIAREIVRAHGGQISAESQPGEGARMVVRLRPPGQ
jgi:heavy metal sensor kinase